MIFTNTLNMIADLNSTNSNNDKIETLAKYKDLEKVLEYTYSPLKQFYITSKAINNFNESSSSWSNSSEENIFDLLDKLNKRELTGHAALASVNGFIDAHIEFKELILNIIDKNLKIRMSASSINKVFPNLIPEFKVQLAEKYEENRKPDFKNETWYYSRKLDGCLDGETLIDIEDGSSLTIREIVNNKIHCKVKTFNTSTKKIQFCDIVDWMKNLEDINEEKTQWFEIELENGNKLKLTGNHMVWLPELSCWRRADELTNEDFVLL